MGAKACIRTLAIPQVVGYDNTYTVQDRAPTNARRGIYVRRTTDDEDPMADANKKRILLVDDDNEIIESMKVVLEAKGFDIMVARDGNQGLAMAEKEDPDLVILDMMMPKRSGFLVLEKLVKNRQAGQARAVPTRFIMITANEGSRHKAYAEMLGVDDYIRKPFAMDKLVDSVQRLLS